MLIKVHTTDQIQETVKRIIDSTQIEETSANGCTWKKWQSTLEFTDYTGKLEVYVDMKKLIEHYAKTAFNNKRLRFVRGPIEVRVVGMKEVPDSRRQEVR